MILIRVGEKKGLYICMNLIRNNDNYCLINYKKTARYNQYDYTLKFLPLANTPLLQDVKTKDKNNVTVALADGKIQNKA